MNVFFVGEYIKDRRVKLGLTQEQVCAGICEPITLSRLENGKQTPSRTRVNAILQRLGLPEDRYYVILSKKELEVEALKKEVIAYGTLKKAEEGLVALRKLEKIVDNDDPLEKQFILRTRVLFGKMSQIYSNDEMIEMLLRAIRLTTKDFDLENIEKHLYTVNEIKIINQLGNAYSNAGDNKKAADIFYQLVRYLKKHHQEVVISSGMLPTVLYNYSRVLDLSTHYDEAINVAEECRAACVKYGHYQYMACCIAIKAECSYFLGNSEMSARYYRQAYYLFDAIQDVYNTALMRKEMLQYLGLLIEDQDQSSPPPGASI